MIKSLILLNIHVSLDNLSFPNNLQVPSYTPGWGEALETKVSCQRIQDDDPPLLPGKGWNQDRIGSPD